MNKLLAKAKKAARKIMRKLGIGKKKGEKVKDDKRTDQEKKADLQSGVQEGTTLIKKEGLSKKEIDTKLEKIEKKYDLKKLTLVKDSEDKGHIHGEVNPTLEGPVVPISFSGSTIQVGAHPIKVTGFESHHVPANNFSKTIGDFYGEVGSLLPSNESFADLKSKLTARKDDIKSTYGDEGNGLSAILIHEGTHRTAKKAVHGTEIQSTVYEKIKAEANSVDGNGKTAVVVIPSTGEERTIANLNSSHWKSFLEQIYRIEKSESTVETNINASKEGALITITGGDKNANKRVAQEITAKANSITTEAQSDKESLEIIKIVNKTTQRGFDEALSNGIIAVSTALDASTNDGDKGQYPKAIKAIKATAKTIWSKLVIKKF
ncbi:MAG: hypothetical protein HYZ43_09105 [Flavobacteriia bacterium]|nr:hypothetical protein [Flavobacteriia bacterium]